MYVVLLLVLYMHVRIPRSITRSINRSINQYMTSVHSSYSFNANNDNIYHPKNNEFRDGFIEINMKNDVKNDFNLNWQEKAAKFQIAVRIIITYIE